MKKFIALLVLLLPISAYSADGDPHQWGTYWTVTGVDTKPGHFDDYLADLKANYRRSLDMQVADGKVNQRLGSGERGGHVIDRPVSD